MSDKIMTPLLKQELDRIARERNCSVFELLKLLKDEIAYPTLLEEAHKRTYSDPSTPVTTVDILTGTTTTRYKY